MNNRFRPNGVIPPSYPLAQRKAPSITPLPRPSITMRGMKLPRFKLRTLFIIVAMLCLPAAWVGNQLMWIHDRHAALDGQGENTFLAFVGPGHGGHFTVPDAPAPWLLRIFGEQGVGGI